MMIRIGFGFQITRPSKARKPTSQSAGMQGRRDAPAVERHHRQQVEEIEEEAEKRERLQRRSSRRRRRRCRSPARRPSRASGLRSRACLAPGVVRHLLERDQRAHERNEQRRRNRQPLPLRLEHVSHLVDEQQAPRGRSRTTSRRSRRRPPADTNIENRNLNLSRTTPNLARNAPMAATGAHSL